MHSTYHAAKDKERRRHHSRGVVQHVTIVTGPNTLLAVRIHLTTSEACAFRVNTTVAQSEELSTYPKDSPGASVLRDAPSPSALLNETVLPHQVWIVLRPMWPLSGYCRIKKIRIAEIATPESRAADNTSERTKRSVSTHQQ